MRRRARLISIWIFLIFFCRPVWAGSEKVPAPVIQSVTAKPDHSVIIKWRKVPSAVSYSVYYKKSGDRKWVRLVSEVRKLSFRHRPDAAFPLEAGQAYEYTVRANRKGKAGKRSHTGVCVVPYVDKSITQGWERDTDHICYRIAGKRASGWNTISGKKYWFGIKTGWLAVNSIAGSGKDYYYVDGSGIQVKDPVVRSAVSFVRKYAGSSHKRLDKLKACYRYIVNKCQYRSAYDEESISKMSAYAQYMFRTHTGNCYRGAAALTYAAKVLGFEARMGVGGVTAYANHSLSTHGWTEVRVGGRWYICDTSMQRHHPDADLFLVSRKEYPYRLRIDDTYELTIQNGKVVWK